MERLLSASATALVGLVLLGVVVRGRARYGRAFVALLGVLMAGQLAATLDTASGLELEAWWLRQLAANAACLLLALELCLAVFPSALQRGRIRAVGLVGALAVALAAAVVASASGSIDVLAGTVLPILGGGAVWLFAGLVALAHWYHVPLHAFHRGVVAGVLLYQCLSVTLLSALAARGFLRDLDALDGPACAASALVWLWAAWRRDRPALLDPAAARLLQPWAVRA
jgi:hypothetical protein